jgi:response regulator RpfG family c-di-GMP phosphodiesterase
MIFVTAFPDESRQRRATEAGAINFLSKPVGKAPYLHRNGKRQQRNLKGAGSEIGTTSVVGAMHNSDRHRGGLVSAEKFQIDHYTSVAMGARFAGRSP